MSDDAPLSDRGARRALTLALLVGAGIGAAVAGPRYGLLDPRAWNVMGLFMIGTVGLLALGILARSRRGARS